MKFYAVIIDEPILGKICCGRSIVGGANYFMIIGKYNKNSISQLKKSELEYFETVTDKIYINNVIGQVNGDGSIHKEIEIKNDDKEYLYTLSGFKFNSTDQEDRSKMMNNYIEKNIDVEILN
jgi:hypothetical protein